MKKKAATETRTGNELDRLRQEAARLRARVVELKQVEVRLREKMAWYQSLFNNAQVGMYRTRVSDGKILDANERFAQLFGYPNREAAMADSLAQDRYVDPGDRRRLIDLLLRDGELSNVEIKSKRRDGSIWWHQVWARIFPDQGFIDSVTTDITDRKMMEEALQAKERELAVQAGKLEEMNAALKVLVNHVERESREKEENIVATIKALVLPYLEKLRTTRVDETQEAYLEIAESNLSKIASPLARRLASWKEGLSPREILVAGMIKEGKSTKEVAHILNLSPETVHSHRKKIRTKLGLTNNKVNLKVHLQSLES